MKFVIFQGEHSGVHFEMGAGTEGSCSNGKLSTYRDGIDLRRQVGLEKFGQMYRKDTMVKITGMLNSIYIVLKNRKLNLEFPCFDRSFITQK